MDSLFALIGPSGKINEGVLNWFQKNPGTTGIFPAGVRVKLH